MALETKFKAGHNYDTLDGEVATIYDIVEHGYNGHPRLLGSITRKTTGYVELVGWCLDGSCVITGDSLKRRKVLVHGFVNIYKGTGFRREHGDVVTTIYTGQVFETREAAVRGMTPDKNKYLATIDISQEVEE